MKLFIVALLVPLALASKILIMPNPESSHIHAMSYTGRALAERGHEVTIGVRYSSKQKPAVIGKMEQLLWGDPDEKEYFSNTEETSQQFLRFYRESRVMESIQFSFFEGSRTACKLLLSDKKYYDSVKARKFDLVIVDGLIIRRCNYIFVHSLGVSYITQTAAFPYDIGMVSNYFGSPFTTASQFLQPDHHVYSDVGKMTFLQRFSNTFSMIIAAQVIQYQINDMYKSFKNYSYDRPLTKSLTQLATESKLWLIEQNSVLDFPRPTYGNIKYIGGMNWKPSKPLTGEYEKVANAASGGFIVISLGADLLSLPKDLGDKMVAGFERLPQYKFIWANKGELTKPVPGNVMKVGFMPQNDLIGHKNCILFITHCGNNGQFEAVGHGVPMLGVPIHRDQPANAWRMVDKGFGLSINLKSVTTDEIVEKITEVITNRKYKDNILKAKAIFHDAPRKPTEEATYWVEHVLKHGADHLKSDAMEMPWYQVLGYDFVAFVLFIIVVFIKLVMFVCCTVRNKMIGTKKAKSD